MTASPLAPPTRTTDTTSFVRGSTWAMVGSSPQPATQSADLVAMIVPHGEAPGGNVTHVLTRFVRASTRTRPEMFESPTQTSPNATPIGCGPLVPAGPTLTVATILLLVGSMREIVPPRCSVTQTAASVATSPAAFGPALIVAVTLFVAGSILRTTFSSKLAAPHRACTRCDARAAVRWDRDSSRHLVRCRIDALDAGRRRKPDRPAGSDE